MSYIKVTADRLSELREAEEKLKTVEAERDDNKRKFKKADSLALEFENKLRTVEAENKKLRECVEFYGDSSNWKKGYAFQPIDDLEDKVNSCGKKARETLKELDELMEKK